MGQPRYICPRYEQANRLSAEPAKEEQPFRGPGLLGCAFLCPFVPPAAFFPAMWFGRLLGWGQRVELAVFVLFHVGCALGWLGVVLGVRGLRFESAERGTKAAGTVAVLLGVFLNGLLSLGILKLWSLIATSR